jgi:glycosyltransferase involved in cell wall biosynthesis
MISGVRIELYIFNLSTDDKDPLLAFNQEWVRSFQGLCDKVTVISTHVGAHSLPSEIEVVEIGGGSVFMRARGFFRLSRVGCRILRSRKNAIVFHHMSPRTALILGPLFKLSKIKQGLWYSHSNASIELQIASRFVNRLFSSSAHSLPIISEKARFVGHGINISRFSNSGIGSRKEAVLSLGRVDRIKHNESLINAMAKSNRKEKAIDLVGPSKNLQAYVRELVALGDRNGVVVNYLGEVEHNLIPELLNQYSICYTGNPNTVDKSVIEGALSGCFTIAEQEFVLDQTGMSVILRKCNIDFSSDLAQQIAQADQLLERDDLRKLLARTCAEMNDVNNTTMKILKELINS